MNYKLGNSGFSLTEVLLSVGVLAVGMIFIAGVFPVAIHYTTIAIEQTKAAIVADEAFAKVRLYAVGDPEKEMAGDDDFDCNELSAGAKRGRELFEFDDDDVFPATDKIDADEFTYPSAGTDISQKRYCWSALCRLTSEYDSNSNPNPDVQVTVFVCRKIGRSPQYYNPDGGRFIDWPRPFKISVSDIGGKDNELRIMGGDEGFVTDGCTIVDDKTGRRYRALERYAFDDSRVLLDADWQGGSHAWVVPPPAAPAGGKLCSGRNPCIAVYQVPYLGVLK